MALIGIVGAEETKFTELGKKRAKLEIAKAISEPTYLTVTTGITSGHCHLGGIDIWAEEAARYIGGDFWNNSLIYPPKTYSWATGYKPRNIQIAQACNFLLNIVVDYYPVGYTGMKFDICYHCIRRGIPEIHVKSGGCWTYWYAVEKLRKKACRLVIKNY